MGNQQSSSKGRDGVSKLDQRIKDLGEQFPFSDRELELLNSCHRNRTLSKASHSPTKLDRRLAGDGSVQTKTPFLLELAICSTEFFQAADTVTDSQRNRICDCGSGMLDIARSCSSGETATTIDEEHSQISADKVALGGIESRRSRTIAQMNFVEGHILPERFGKRLEKVAFSVCLDQPVGWNASSSSTNLKTANEERSLHEFLDGLTRCFGRRGLRSSLEIMFACCCDESNQENVKAHDLITLGFRLAIASYFLGEKHVFDSLDTSNLIPSESSLSELSRSLSDATEVAKLPSSFSTSPGCQAHRGQSPPTIHEGMVSRSVFVEWAENTLPLLSATLPTFMHRLLFPDLPFSPSRQPFLFPRIYQSSAFFKSQFSPRLFSYACMSFSLGGRWHRLYTSESDGLSFNRLCLSLLGYAGPTLMIVSASSGGVFGAFSSNKWKESKDFYGTSDCFLYQLEPLTGVFRPGGMESNFMYCNPESRSKGYDGLAHGIGFGGTSERPRLYISESFEGCAAGSRDMSFEPGALLPPAETGADDERFEIESLEVWGVGGDAVVSEALGARGKEREAAAANIRKAKKGDKAAFLEDLQSGLFESKAFKHRGEVDKGRVDADEPRNEKENKVN